MTQLQVVSYSRYVLFYTKRRDNVSCCKVMEVRKSLLGYHVTLETGLNRSTAQTFAHHLVFLCLLIRVNIISVKHIQDGAE